MATTHGDGSGHIDQNGDSTSGSGASEATRSGGDVLGMIAGAALMITAVLAVLGTVGYMVVSAK